MSHSPSPAVGVQRTSVGHGSSNDGQHGAALQTAVENERQDVLSDVKEQNAQQFDAVESLHEKLKETTENALDIFTRQPPKTIEQTTTNNDQHLQQQQSTKTAVTITAAEPAMAKDQKAGSSVYHANASVVPVSGPSSSLHVNDDLDRSYLQPAGFEKNTAIIQQTRKPSMEVDEKEAQIQSLSFSLIQTRQAHQDLMNQLYRLDQGAAAVGVDARDTDSDISASSLLTSVPITREKSLLSYLSDLPVKKGWLMLRTGHSAASPASYTKYFFTLTFDGLYFSESEDSAQGHKIDLEHYWLIEKTEDRNRKENHHNYAASATATSNPPNTQTSTTAAHPPLAGVSVFRLEDGAYVIRLVPIITNADQPQMVIEPSRSQVLELTGASENDVSDSSTLSAWVDAINLRISLLSLSHHPQCSYILAHGGRELLTFLCSVDNKSLVIENKYLDAALIFGFFKESLIHRLDWSLILKNVALNDSGMQVLTEILMLNHTIYHINFSHNSITDNGLAYLATVFEVNPRIQSLDLSYNQIGQEGLSDLAAVISKHSISSLTLQGNHLSDQSLLAFYEILKKNASALRGFTLLDFSFNELSDQSAITIAKMLSSFVISALRLSGNGLTDSGVHSIVGAVSVNSTAFQSLTLLDLSYNKLTTKATPELVNLLNYCATASLDVSGNSEMTVAGLEPLINSGLDLTIESLRLKKRRLVTSAVSSGPIPSFSKVVAAGVASDSPKPTLVKRLSIVKENISGNREVIDPLHPRDETQLGRSVHEVSEEDKSNQINASGTTIAATGLPSAAHHPPVTSLFDRLTKGTSSASSTTSSTSASPKPSTSHSPADSLSAHGVDDKHQVLDVPHTAASTELLVDGGKTADPRAVVGAGSNVHVDTDSADARSLAAEAANETEAAKAREMARTHHSSHSSVVTQPQSMFTQTGLQPATPQQIQKERTEAALKGKYPQTDLNYV